MTKEGQFSVATDQSAQDAASSGRSGFESLQEQYDDLREKYARAVADNETLRARESQRDVDQRTARKRMWSLSWAVLKSLWGRIAGRDVRESAKRAWDSLLVSGRVGSGDVIDLGVAVLYRLTGIGIFTLVVAMVPIVLTWRQTDLMSSQNELIAAQSAFLREQTQATQGQLALQQEQLLLQRSEGAAVRSASLVAILYDRQHCDAEDKRTCPFVADGRTRAEAAVAYAEIVRSNRKEVAIRGSPFAAIGHYRQRSLVNLVGVDLTQLAFWGANLSRVDMSSGELWGADFGGADLEDAIFSGARMGAVDMQSSRADGVDMTWCKCGHIQLTAASLRRGVFLSANLSGASMAASDFSDADIRDVNFTDAFFGLPDAPPKFRGAIYDDTTEWPKGFTESDARRLGAMHVTEAPRSRVDVMVQSTGVAGVVSPPGKRLPHPPGVCWMQWQCAPAYWESGVVRFGL